MKQYLNTIIYRIYTLFVNKMGIVVLAPSMIKSTNAQGVLYCGGDCEDEEECCGGEECGCEDGKSEE